MSGAPDARTGRLSCGLAHVRGVGNGTGSLVYPVVFTPERFGRMLVS